MNLVAKIIGSVTVVLLMTEMVVPNLVVDLAVALITDVADPTDQYSWLGMIAGVAKEAEYSAEDFPSSIASVMGLIEGWKHGNVYECSHEFDVHEPPATIGAFDDNHLLKIDIQRPGVFGSV